MRESNFEFSGVRPDQEKELTSEEREGLKSDMNEYLSGLKARIEEIGAEIESAETKEDKEALQIELAELKERAFGLDEFVGDIDEAESIKIKPHESAKE